MAAEDWKGVAMVLQQLGEMAKPSQLDIIDKKFELESLQKEADREHQFMLKNYEIAQNQYNDLQTRYQSAMDEGSKIDAELTKLQGKPINFSGDAQKVHNAIYKNSFTNYDAGIKMLNDNIGRLRDELSQAESINKAAKLGDQFTTDYKLGGQNYFMSSQIKFDNDGNPLNEFVKDDKGAYIADDATKTFRIATQEQIDNKNIQKYNKQLVEDELLDDLSYNESLYAIKQASEQIPEGSQRDAFIIAAEGNLNQESERKATSTAGKTESSTKSSSDKIGDAVKAMQILQTPEIQELLASKKYKEMLNPPDAYKDALKMKETYRIGLKEAIAEGRSHELLTLGAEDFFRSDLKDGVTKDKGGKYYITINDEKIKLSKESEMSKIFKPSQVTVGFGDAGGLDYKEYKKIITLLDTPISDPNYDIKFQKGLKAKKIFHAAYFDFYEYRQTAQGRNTWDTAVRHLKEMLK